MKKGEIIKYDNIDYKRPAEGFDPEMTEFVVGRTVNKNLKSDHILTQEDII
jgi:N-acetylneuraminate synthase